MERVRVYDNFLDNVDLQVVTESAYAAGFGRWAPEKGLVGTSIYDGMNFMGSHALALRELIGHTGRVVVPNTLFFRLTNEGMEKAYIHSDREMGDHTCVLYLTDHTGPSGTAFFRHKPTGLVEMPSAKEMHDSGMLEQLRADMVSRDPEKWEIVGFVEGKRNRAVVFDAPLFHARVPFEGTAIDEDRLVWVSHFYNLVKGELT